MKLFCQCWRQVNWEMDARAKYVRYVEKKDLSVTSSDTLRHLIWKEWKFLANIVEKYASRERVCANTFKIFTDGNDLFSSRMRNLRRESYILLDFRYFPHNIPVHKLLWYFMNKPSEMDVAPWCYLWAVKEAEGQRENVQEMWKTLSLVAAKQMARPENTKC